MAVRIERTNGLVLMSLDELHAAAAQKDGEILIRLSADALHRPGAFFSIHSENREEAMPPVNQNTSPTFPPVPDDGTSPMAGIETPATTDNLQGETA